jgi:ubiquinol-cytochrome c reductase iron-sulfur subunit
MKVTIEWRKRPVFIVRRTPEMLASMEEVEPHLEDPASKKANHQPNYAQNPVRSIKPEYLVMVGVCTHLGCSPTFKPELTPQPFDAEWQGGFYCPCHNSRFDLAGRVYSGVPAPTNLKVPPYRFTDENHIEIGVNPEGAA